MNYFYDTISDQVYLSPLRVAKKTKLICVRGTPGSGKSFLAKVFTQAGYAHFEADMFFVNEKGEYKFDQSKLKDAHNWCFEQTRKNIEAGKKVVVSNTFSMRWELKKYTELVEYSKFSVYKMTSNFGSIHNVPLDVIRRMHDRWEDIEDEIELPIHKQVWENGQSS